MHKISVVFVTSVFEEGREGPAIYARYLYEHFKNSSDINFQLVVTQASQLLPNIHVAGIGSSSYETYKKLQLKALSVVSQLAGRVIVHGNSAHAMWMFRGCTNPLLVQVNDYDPATVINNTFWYLKKFMWRRYFVLHWRRINEKRVVLGADAVVCNSQYTANIIREKYRPEEHRIKVVYKAADTQRFMRPDDEKFTQGLTRKKGFRLIFVGTNWQRKGLVDLLQALIICRKKIPGVSLEVIGPIPSELSNEVLALVKDEKLSEIVQFSGRVSREDLPAHFWRADLAVLPSHQEALGVSILEALAAGVPVLATRVGGIPEILNGAGCGVMLPPGDSAELADKIVNLYSDSAALVEMGAAGAIRAKAFGTEAMLNSIEALYLSFS